MINVVPLDYIACIKWPKESIEKINQLKRTFLWKNVLPKISVDCLVACDRVILPKINGGLGDRNLTAHNDVKRDGHLSTASKLSHKRHTSIGDAQERQ